MNNFITHEKGFSRLSVSNDPTSANKITPIIIPSQLHNTNSQLQYNNTIFSLEKYSKAHASLALKQLCLLLPTVTARNSMDFTQITRQAHTSVDNTMFVYPTMLDRFKNRYAWNMYV